MQLRCENKIRIDRRCFPAPQSSQFRTDVSVKRSIDFDDVEEASQKFNGMNFLTRYFGRVEGPVPVFIRPASSANADSRRRVHEQQARCRRLARVWREELKSQCGAETSCQPSAGNSRSYP